MRTRTPIVGSAAVLALALAGCSSPEPEAAQPTTEAAPPQAEAGLVVDATEAGLTTSHADPGEDARVVVPSGEVSVDSTGTTDTIPAALADAGDAAGASDAGGDEETLVPADGEVFRVVTVTYQEASADEGEAEDTESAQSGGDVQLGIEVAGQSQDAPGEGPQQGESVTYVVAVPDDEESFLVVTEEGKAQKLDLETGERDEETEAAGFYREPSEMDVAASIELGTAEAEATGGISNEIDKSTAFTPQLTVDRAAFTAWTPEDGWASDGQAWLTLDGGQSMNSSGDGQLQAEPVSKVVLSADGEDLGSFTVEGTGDLGSSMQEFTQTVSVPADAESVTLTATSSLSVTASASWTLESDAAVTLDEVEQEIDLAG